MNESEKRSEVAKLLIFIYAEWAKEITNELCSFWCVNLQGVGRTDAWDAARMLVKKKTYGEPKLQDFYECLAQVRIARAGRRSYNPWASPESAKDVLDRVLKEDLRLDMNSTDLIKIQ